MNAEELSPKFESYLDDLSGGKVRGWAWLPDDPQAVVDVELVDHAGTVVAKAQARRFRGDLASAEKRGGYCAFELSAPDGPGPYVLRIRHPLHPDDGLVLAEGVEAASPRRRESILGRFRASANVLGCLDRASPTEISGWCHQPDPFQAPVRLTLVENGRTLATTTADRWREDVGELRLGDGRCGFRFVPPASLYDDQEHQLELWLDTGEVLTEAPFTVKFPDLPPARTGSSAAPDTPRPQGAPVISVIVNFYNMRREAERTLQSLARRFQLGVEDMPYEVICVDNGSDPPLGAAFVESFGPEFRLFRPSKPNPSPCGPLNEAAESARGRWLAVMIDGAHILSPGALREAHNVLAAQPDAIIALRQWFIGGDQRWFSASGYRREQEDVLFSRIDWPHDGYRLFDISSPMYESPNAWLDGMSESNCLFLPRETYRSIGGFDEAFNIPGAGYANLDFFRRAHDASSGLVALVGEASFHQYHGGVTTNAHDLDKDGRVRFYASQYERLRGAPFVNVAPEEMRLSGSIRTGLALTGRQRPFCPAGIGVTSEIRPRPISLQFDEEAQQYVQSAYVETGLHLETRWCGQQVEVAPSDLIDIQEALWRVKPERLILRSLNPGLVSYIAALVKMLGLDARIVWTTDRPQDAIAGTEQLVGYPDGDDMLSMIQAAVEDAEHVLVIYSPDADSQLPVDGLALYSQLVTFGSYLIVLKTAFGRPWLGYARSSLYRAIVRLTQSDPSLVIDRTLSRHFVTTSPSGFVRRVLSPQTFRQYDESVDDLSGL